MTVRAKFKVDSIENTAECSMVKMTPVTTGSEENKRFYHRWTPAGSIVLSSVNKDVAKQFEPGEEYFLDFSRAPKGSSSV